MDFTSFQIFILVTLVCVNFAGEDFYALLGVDKGATTKEIRKAFKKLAITKHPDKNTVSFISKLLQHFKPSYVNFMQIIV